MFNRLDFDETELIYDELQLENPYDLEYVDIYSNVLYVKNKPAELALLAQKVSNLDISRPESCNVIGNFYSLRGERLVLESSH